MAVREIALTGAQAAGRTTLVDDEDYERVSAYTWWCNSGGYAMSVVPTPNGPRRQRGLLLHRLVLDIVDEPELQADHINRVRLDNRRSNLRAVPPAVNGQNKGSNGGRSRFRGVYRERERWRARIMLCGRKYSLGYYDDEMAAARAVEAFRAERMPWVSPDRALRPLASWPQ